MPRLRQVGKNEAHPFAQTIYTSLFGERDPIANPGTATGQQPKFDTRAMYAKASSAHGLWLSRLSLKENIMRPAWERLSQWIKEGKLRPVVGHVLPLAKAGDAFRLMLERKNYGKVVLTVS